MAEREPDALVASEGEVSCEREGAGDPLLHLDTETLCDTLELPLSRGERDDETESRGERETDAERDVRAVTVTDDDTREVRESANEADCAREALEAGEEEGSPHAVAVDEGEKAGVGENAALGDALSNGDVDSQRLLVACGEEEDGAEAVGCGDCENKREPDAEDDTENVSCADLVANVDAEARGVLDGHKV